MPCAFFISHDSIWASAVRYVINATKCTDDPVTNRQIMQQVDALKIMLTHEIIIKSSIPVVTLRSVLPFASIANFSPSIVTVLDSFPKD